MTTIIEYYKFIEEQQKLEMKYRDGKYHGTNWDGWMELYKIHKS